MKRLIEAKYHLGKWMHVRSMRLRFVKNSLKPFKELQSRLKISQIALKLKKRGRKKNF
jgi:hypothetical protein